MGIELQFNPGSPHLFKAAQTLAYTEQLGDTFGIPTVNPSNLAWNDDLIVTAQAVNPSVDVEVGSFSKLTARVTDTSFNDDVYTRKTSVVIDQAAGSGQGFNRVTAIQAAAQFSAVGDATVIASLAAGRFRVDVTGAGAGTVINELSAIEIEAPNINATPASYAALRIKDQGAANIAIKTGTGLVQLGGTTSVTGTLTATGSIGTNSGYARSGVQVVGARNTGWNAWTGASSKATFDTATATTANVAQALKALLDALTTHGLIGA